MKKNKKLNKRILKAVFLSVGLFSLFFSLYAVEALNTASSGYRVDKSTVKFISYVGETYQVRVTNNNAMDIFVPTKTKSEKDSFCNVAVNIECCEPVLNGGWSAWGAYSACTKSCGSGTKTRYRNCNNPAPNCGGANCAGINSQTASCNTQPCCTGWSAWYDTSGCSKTCGGGTKNQGRNCSSPSGCSVNQCSGSSTQTVGCNTQACCSYSYKDWCIGVGKLKWERTFPDCSKKTGTQACSGCTGSVVDSGCGEDG